MNARWFGLLLLAAGCYGAGYFTGSHRDSDAVIFAAVTAGVQLINVLTSGRGK